MGNTLLQNNPTAQDIKIFLRKINANIDNYNITFNENNELLTISSTSTQIIQNN